MASNKAIAAEGFLREFSIFSSPKDMPERKLSVFTCFHGQNSSISDTFFSGVDLQLPQF